MHTKFVLTINMLILFFVLETRAGWNCSNCSKCQICREVDGTEGRFIKCEQCQRLYHNTCLRPSISSLPKYGWKCNVCMT